MPMGIKFEVRIEGHSQYTWVPFQKQYEIGQSDLGMNVRLRKLRGESSDGGLWTPAHSSIFDAGVVSYLTTLKSPYYPLKGLPV